MKCAFCSKLANKYCDVCDEPVCLNHSEKIANDTDVCPNHNTPEFHELAINRHNELMEVQEYFREKYEQASFRVVPGHWPDFKTKQDVDKWIKRGELILEMFSTDT